MLIIRLNAFELIQTKPRYINVTDGQTDNVSVAIPRFTLRASRGNKTFAQHFFYFAYTCSYGLTSRRVRFC